MQWRTLVLLYCWLRIGNAVSIISFLHSRSAARFWVSCHLGKSIVYDTVSELGWSVSVRYHGILSVINDILGNPWRTSEEVGKETPEATADEDCVVRVFFKKK